QNSAPNYFADALDPQLVEKANLLDIQRSAQIFEQHGMNPAQAQEWAKFVSDHYRPAPAVTVNSPYSRSQELLHLHLDHIDPKIHGELAKIAERNGFSKTSFESIEDLIPGEAENLKAMWVPADAQGGLGDTNPFKKVYESLPDNLKPTIDEHSIALVPMKYQNAPGFLIIDGQASMKGAALEWLQHYTAWMNEGKPNL
ncbi:MAG: CDP-diacylglycerol diphosphatase, partial [Candidatus Obscuribacterales bacterium]|nr:CDP-diacylglycerol diphosphatase [Candidatus Obscuribacterales bacterium]